jgi:hypothetical protein
MLYSGLIALHVIDSNWGGYPMSSEHKEVQYRGFAASCLDLAKSSPTFADKTRLLTMAEAWLNLADRVAQLAKHPVRKIVDHPLVRKTLGGVQGAEAE